MSQPWAIVASVCLEWGWTPRETTNRLRPLVSLARYPAAPTALGPSYTDAFDTGSPVSSEIAVWYSNIAWRPPCEISGWYGVYGGRNSQRWMIESMSART